MKKLLTILLLFVCLTIQATDKYIATAATWSGGTPGFNGSGALLIGGTLRMRIYNDTLTQPYRGAGVNGWLIKYIAGGWDKGLEIFNNVITKPFYTDDYWKFSCEIWNTRGGFKFYNNTVEGELDMGGSTYLNNDEGEYGFTYKIYNNTFGPATAPARYSDGVQFETGLTGGAYVYNNLFRNLYVGLSMTQNANLIKTVPLVFQDVYVSYNIFKDVGIAGDGWGILSYCAAVTDGGTAIVDNINFDNNTFYSAAFTPRAAIKFQTQATNTNIRIRNNIIQGFAYCFESSGVTPTNGTIDNLYLQNNINYGNGNSNNPYYNGLTPSNVTVSDTLKRNPKFITPGSDFHLQATSPARDAGINVGQTHDYGNNNVPFGSRFDIGALEYIDDVVIYPPVVNLSNITSYTAISATTGGTVTDDGGGTVSERGICWSTSMYPTVYDDTIRLGSGTGTFTGTITGLLGSTMYHVRGYAINELGYDSAGYGFDVGFTTLNYPVVVVSASILMSDGKVVILKGTTSLPPVTPPAGTQNLVKYSEELDGDVNDAWAFTNLTVTNNQDYDLAGGLTLEKLTITDATHIIGYTDYYDGTSHYFTTVPGTTYRFSWDVKQGTMTDMKWSVLDRTHDVEIIAPTSYYFRTSSSVQRVSLEFTAPTGCTSVFLYMLRNSGATGTVYMGRIQMESNGSIYIKTTSAIITP